MADKYLNLSGLQAFYDELKNHYPTTATSASTALYLKTEPWNADINRYLLFGSAASSTDVGYDGDLTYNPNKNLLKVSGISATNVTANGLTANSFTGKQLVTVLATACTSSVTANTKDTVNALSNPKIGFYNTDATQKGYILWTDYNITNTWVNADSAFFGGTSITDGFVVTSDQLNSILVTKNLSANNFKANTISATTVSANLSGWSRSASTASYAVSAGAAPVASHQFSAHTNFSTYFDGTSAKYAKSATSAATANKANSLVYKYLTANGTASTVYQVIGHSEIRGSAGRTTTLMISDGDIGRTQVTYIVTFLCRASNTVTVTAIALQTITSGYFEFGYYIADGICYLVAQKPSWTSDARIHVIDADAGFVLDPGSNTSMPTGYTKGSNLRNLAYEYSSDTTVIGKDSQASDCKTYFTNMPNGTIRTVYNDQGNEYTIIFSKAASGNYGNIIKYGYTDSYLYILRYKAGSWQSSDWEKISAGYADSAGTANYALAAKSGSVLEQAIAPDADVALILYGDSTYSSVKALYNAGKKLYLMTGGSIQPSGRFEYRIPLTLITYDANLEVNAFYFEQSQDDRNGASEVGSIAVYRLDSTGWTTTAKQVGYAENAGNANNYIGGGGIDTALQGKMDTNGSNATNVAGGNIIRNMNDWTNPGDAEMIAAASNTGQGKYTLIKLWNNYLKAKAEALYASKHCFKNISIYSTQDSDFHSQSLRKQLGPRYSQGQPFILNGAMFFNVTANFVGIEFSGGLDYTTIEFEVFNTLQSGIGDIGLKLTSIAMILHKGTSSLSVQIPFTWSGGSFAVTLYCLLGNRITAGSANVTSHYYGFEV